MKDNSTHNSHIHAWKKPTCVGAKICLASGKYTWKIECCGYRLVLAESWRKKTPNNVNILSIIMLYLFNPLICFFLIFYCAHHSNFLSDILKLEQICITKSISWCYLIFLLLKLSLCLCQKLFIICTIGGSTWNCCAGGWGKVVHKVCGRTGVWLDSCAVLPCWEHWH